MEPNETSELISGQEVFRRDPRRFLVLVIFGHLAFNQSMIWLTFSPIALNAEIFYGIDESTIDLLLNWGPIIFIPCLPLSYFLLKKNDGLEKSVRILALIDLLAASIRLVPIFLGKFSVFFLHVGQILNGACGPLVMAPVCQLSSLWFPAEERTRATSLAIFSNNFGSTIGFLLSPLIVSSPSSIPTLLYLHFGLTVSGFLLTFLFFPLRPRSAASASGEFLLNESRNSILDDLKISFSNRSFLLITGAGGLLSGTFSCWTSLFDVILKNENFTENQRAWFGFSASIFGIVGGFVSSSLADRKRFQRSLKTLIVFCLFFCFLSICFFEFSVPSFFTEKTIFPTNIWTIGLSTSFAGFFCGGASPLIYESLSELTFPLRESFSTSILVETMNFVSIFFLLIAANRSKLINFLVPIIVFIVILLILFSKFLYKRRDEDFRREKEKINSTVET